MPPDTLTTFRTVPWNLPFYARMGFAEIPRETPRPELAAVVSEEADRGLMRCYAATGQRGLALRQYQDCIRRLRNDVDAAPSDETTALYRIINPGNPPERATPGEPREANPWM